MTAWRTSCNALIDIEVDGRTVSAVEGEPLAAALIAAGHWRLGRTATGQPRGPFCMIGLCQDCVVTVNGQPGVRSCTTAVTAGLCVSLDDAR